jgi:hypothetical protein
MNNSRIALSDIPLGPIGLGYSSHKTILSSILLLSLREMLTAGEDCACIELDKRPDGCAHATKKREHMMVNIIFFIPAPPLPMVELWF